MEGADTLITDKEVHSNDIEMEMEAIDLEVTDYVPVPTKDIQGSDEDLKISSNRRMSKMDNKMSDEMNAKLVMGQKGKIIVMVVVFVIAVILISMAIYFGTKKKDQRDVDPINRWNCTAAWVNGSVSEEQCSIAGCWFEKDDPAVNYGVIPECFYPYPKYGYHIDSAYVDKTSSKLELELSWKEDNVPGTVNKVLVTVSLGVDGAIKTMFQISSATLTTNGNMIPGSGVRESKSSSTLGNFIVEHGTGWFYLCIKALDGARLFDTRSSPLIFHDNSLLQLTIQLEPSYSLYTTSDDPYNVTYRTIHIPRNDDKKARNYNLPFYTARRESGRTHGVVFYSDEAYEMYLTPRPSVTFTTSGREFSIYILLGPTVASVNRQLVNTIDMMNAMIKPPVPELWFFGSNFEGSAGSEQVMKEDFTAMNIPVDEFWEETKKDDMTAYMKHGNPDNIPNIMRGAMYIKGFYNGLCLRDLRSWDSLKQAVIDLVNANIFGITLTGPCDGTCEDCEVSDELIIKAYRLKIWFPFLQLSLDQIAKHPSILPQLKSTLKLRKELTPTWLALFEEDQTSVVRLTSYNFPNNSFLTEFDQTFQQIMLGDIIVVPVGHLLKKGSSGQYYLPKSAIWSWFEGSPQTHTAAVYSKVESGLSNYTDSNSADKYYVKSGTVLCTYDVTQSNRYHLTILLDDSNKAKSIGSISVIVDGNITITVPAGDKRSIVITMIRIQDLSSTLSTPISYTNNGIDGAIEYEDIDYNNDVVTLHHTFTITGSGVVIKAGVPQ